MKEIINKISKINRSVWLFLGIAVLILWQMLLPGYVLTLDMVFGPEMKVAVSADSFHNSLPIAYLIYFLSILIPVWLIQKIILLVLFFCLGYLAFKFLPLSKKYYLNYWGALFYVINPFVYERFLAGHWAHLFAYAFLPPFSYYLIKLFKSPTNRNTAWAFFWLFLIGLFSLNFLIIAAIASAFYLVFLIFKNLFSMNAALIKKVFLKLLIGGFIFLIASSYWIAPYLLKGDQSAINVFNRENWEAFKTSADQRLGTALNVAALYGFWGERLPWAKYFLWPKDNLYLFLPLFGAILFLVGWGIINRFRKKDFFSPQTRGKVGWGAEIKNNTSPQPPPQLRRGSMIAPLFLIAGLAGFVFSCGVGDTIFKGFNQWLFEHIWFWPGFRDSQKWSGLLVLSYVYFGSLGAYNLLEKINPHTLQGVRVKAIFPRAIKYFIVAIFLIPIFYTYTMLGGFARQLKPVWYPESWHKTNQILNQDKDNFKVLFLPWHQYLSFDFNHKLITASPAKIFFDKEIIQGQNMELGKIFSQGGNEEYQEIENIILKSGQTPVDSTINALFAKNIKYIIYVKDLEDIEKMDFLYQPSNSLEKVFESGNLTLFKLKPLIGR